MPLIDYAVPGPLTDLHGVPHGALPDVPPQGTDPLAVCTLVQGLVVQPADAQALGLPARRLAAKDVRPAAALVAELLALDPAPLTDARPPQLRVVGTCRHFAVLAVALLRRAGLPARARCGFATYFEPGRGLDHWVVEHRTAEHGATGRWRRVDAEVAGTGVVADELGPEEFLTGGEAWAAYRRGALDASRFGVPGTRDAWGPAELKGNAIRDLAALNKVEVLPWDEWGRMADAYRGATGRDHDALVDTVAAVCGADDPAFVSDLYAREELRVPGYLLR